ncbi:hypothetical protein EMIT036CA2_30412 [Chryseobacterium sp. IT-36CA2]
MSNQKPRMNFGKFGDEFISTSLILRQKVSNFIFKLIILALILYKYVIVIDSTLMNFDSLKLNLPLKKIILILLY